MATKTLLQELATRRDDFVHVKREAPWIHLTRKRDQNKSAVQLLDVGTDFIEVGIVSRGTNQLVSRDQIAEIVWVGKGN